MSKNITSFAAFLEQTERKSGTSEATRAENVPHVDLTPDAEIASDTNFASRVDIASREDSASDVKTRLEPVRKVRDAENTSHAENAPIRGHLRVPNEILYNIFPSLKPSEAIVLLRLYALSHGFQKNTCTVSLDKLASGSNLSRTQTRVCVRSLERKRFIKSRGTDNTNSQKHMRGLHFEVNLPSPIRADSAPHTKSASRAENAPNKVNTQKENTQTQDAPAAGVGVGSKFTLEECRRYARHLQSTGQGINNPGGYATTIHRTGEADLLIESFLHPEAAGEPSANLDTSQCPDCNGTGFYYPQGTEGGVARCKHERLRKGSEE
jgi:hypothetical protein